MNLSSIPWGTIILIAIAVVGIVQWLKGAAKKAPSWLWALAAVILCAGLAAAAAYKLEWILYAAVALSFAQLCYEIIIQGIPTIVTGLLGAKPSAPKAEDAGPGVPGS